jgi:uncharacterized protein YrrD
MLRINDIIGIQVAIQHDNELESLETVKDAILDRQLTRLLGLLVNRGGWSGSAQVLLWNDVVSIDSTMVLAQSKDSIIPAYLVPDIRQILETGRTYQGKSLKTSSGRYLGTLLDFVFDPQTGYITGCQIGMRFVPQSPQIAQALYQAQPDKDGLIVPSMLTEKLVD